ncbi:glycosyltransferase family 2 protein [Mangrovimonas futianensis]|uniref:glycosyltransferase family 2 protein n=1 Tax=Mangrovimonas futianensis TaxID=2895523 RepID=UPI001E4FDE5E|nr:glycosyltransferase family A protein [Mangrovimonas futianensis]MCF1421399.1 glycosyltransferase family 2 protein [Mangrovimonas futianensis]
MNYGLSIITPHYNYIMGLEKIYSCLKVQTLKNWQWVIVDDFSDEAIVTATKKWYQQINDERVLLVCNSEKTNASVCRNQGATKARFESLVFLDADDTISKDFVKNRHLVFNDFVVFKNWAVLGADGSQVNKGTKRQDYLNCFLNAKFIWQTSTILWKKSFFNQIGQFDPNLERLQDVELSIRGLLLGNQFQVIDNKIDFYYTPNPIRSKTDIVERSCRSVNYLISKIEQRYSLNASQIKLLQAYYFACVKNLQRTKNRSDVVFVKQSLILFREKRFINFYQSAQGIILLFLYRYQLISDSLFLKWNRYLFK